MRRLHGFEIHDQPWCPPSVRDALTAFLGLVTQLGGLYDPVADRLARAISRSGTRQVVDLCSGSGGPWPSLAPRIAGGGAALDVVLTDKYPNPEGAAKAPGIRYHPHPVDATAVPGDLRGFRTLFTAFHHFPPDQARAILEDAVRAGQGIGVFELTHRSATSIGWVLLSPLGIALLMPFARPFRWTHLLWTYVIPAFPLVEVFDGVVSCFRTYTPAELKRLTDGLGGRGRTYAWEVGEARSRWAPVPVTYCIGCPR